MKFEVVVTILDDKSQPVNKTFAFESDTPPETLDNESLAIYDSEADDDDEYLAVFHDWQYWRKIA